MVIGYSIIIYSNLQYSNTVKMICIQKRLYYTYQYDKYNILYDIDVIIVYN